MKKALLSILVAMLILSLAACLVSPDDNADLGTNESDSTEVIPNSPDQNNTEVITTSTYELNPNKTDQENLVDGNSTFAFNLYQTLINDPENKEQNLFFSPYSISLALAMAHAGARADTEQQLCQTMNFLLPQDRLHSAFRILNAKISRRIRDSQNIAGDNFRLNIANAIWGQQGYGFLPEFTDLLATNYEAGIRTLDFINAPEESRITINNWVSDQTEGRIKDVIPPGCIDAWTKLVLANAIYFKADWESKFPKQSTMDDTFYLLNGKTTTVPMMTQTTKFKYSESVDYQAVALPYKGNTMSMVIILPKHVNLVEFEKSLEAKRLDEIVNELKSTYVELAMPKYKFESDFSLSHTLSAMGMPVAFKSPKVLGVCSKEWADFSGMTGQCECYIKNIFHKAFVDVNEECTEAAAATVIIEMAPGESSAPEIITMIVDHPFIFLIKDNETGTILFLGRVTDPSQ